MKQTNNNKPQTRKITYVDMTIIVTMIVAIITLIVIGPEILHRVFSFIDAYFFE